MKDKALADIGGDSACPVPPLRKRAMMTYYLYMSFHNLGSRSGWGEIPFRVSLVIERFP
jgi:hypothetical protein